MMRKQHSSDFKAKVALAALRGDKTTAELSSEYQVNGNLINRWKTEAKERMPAIFAGTDRAEVQQHKEKIEELYKTIGRTQVENEWMRKKLGV
jgi:transposase